MPKVSYRLLLHMDIDRILLAMTKPLRTSQRR
jgi:hypothetical protein